jgi:hypothetical protein
MLSHLARLGGVLIRPRSTLLAILEGDEGRAWHVFPWIAVVAAASAPVETGRAILMTRVDPLVGVWAFLAMIADRCGPGLVGAVIAAFVLQLLKVHFDRAFDCTMHMLAPYLLLAAIGAGLSAVGAEVWFLPHRRMTGAPWVIALRATVAYGWSLILFLVVLVSVARTKSGGQADRS